jgi:hypothetical protein
MYKHIAVTVPAPAEIDQSGCGSSADIVGGETNGRHATETAVAAFEETVQQKQVYLIFEVLNSLLLCVRTTTVAVSIEIQFGAQQSRHRRCCTCLMTGHSFLNRLAGGCHMLPGLPESNKWR